MDTLFSISLEEALERIKNKNKKTVLRELGVHPASGEALQIIKGRYGPYVSDVKLNANIGRDADPEEVTIEEAVSLLAVAATKKKTTKKKVTKKKTVKKKVTKKKTTKKKVTKKKVTKKAVKKIAVKSEEPANPEPTSE